MQKGRNQFIRFRGKEGILEVEPLRFVQSKVTEDNSFWPFQELSGAGIEKLRLPNMVVTNGSWREDRPEMSFPAVKTEKVSSAQAVAGTSQPTNQAILGMRLTDGAKRRCSSPAEGRRGRQERNCVSSESISFISCFFQLEFNFLQTVTIAARSRVR